jgi:hypothetical protein
MMGKRKVIRPQMDNGRGDMRMPYDERLQRLETPISRLYGLLAFDHSWGMDGLGAVYLRLR